MDVTEMNYGRDSAARVGGINSTLELVSTCAVVPQPKADGIACVLTDLDIPVQHFEKFMHC